jgi:site-specific DNA recombinase
MSAQPSEPLRPVHAVVRPRYQPEPLPNIAALYPRVSSKPQGEEDKASLPTQLAALKKLAAQLGADVDERYIYEERASGEELHQRPALSRLREDVRSRRFRYVLAYNPYALAKRREHMAILLDEWEQRGVTVRFATEQPGDTREAKIVADLNTYATEIDTERRKDRMHRALMDRVHRHGQAANKVRPSFGYQWADERDKEGKLLKERQVRNDQTWPIAERIWTRALAGHTLRRIAADLTADGEATPQGRRVWDPSTVRHILTNGIYWGQPVTLRRVQVPVDPQVRQYYAHKSRACRRPEEEQVTLGADYAPAMVTPEDAARVQARLRLNKELATPNAPQPETPDDLLLLRGLARCGYCGGRLGVHHPKSRRPGARRVIYKCRKGQKTNEGCQHHSIAAHTLDAAVWARVCEVLTHPTLIEQEVKRLRETPDPAADTLAAIDRQVADLVRRIKNKREYATLVDDARERAEVAAEVTQLRKQQDALEGERAATLAHYAGWREQAGGLEQVLAWCQRWAGNLDGFTPEERQRALFALRVDVRLYRADHAPRAEVTLTLPVSGALATELQTERVPAAAFGEEHCRSCSTPSLTLTTALAVA